MAKWSTSRDVVRSATGVEVCAGPTLVPSLYIDGLEEVLYNHHHFQSDLNEITNWIAQS